LARNLGSAKNEFEKGLEEGKKAVALPTTTEHVVTTTPVAEHVVTTTPVAEHVVTTTPVAEDAPRRD
jgi:hypothetical protein